MAHGRGPEEPKPRGLELRDGRHLGYIEIGDPHGLPIVYCHGILGSRLESLLLDPLGRELGLRVVSPDRPGYGLSSPAPHHRLIDWVVDLNQLLDRLRLQRVSIVGVSGGGPYALAFLHQHPERALGAALVASLAPIGQGLPLRSLLPPVRWLFEWALHAPWLLDLALMPIVPLLRHRPLEALAWATRSTPAVDHAAIASPELQALFKRSIPEAVRQGPRGVLEDLVLLRREWGFSLEAVQTRVELWHGEADVTVPAIAGHYLEAQLPRCQAHYLAGAGHVSLPATQARAILEALLGAAGPDSAEPRSASPSPRPDR